MEMAEAPEEDAPGPAGLPEGAEEQVPLPEQAPPNEIQELSGKKKIYKIYLHFYLKYSALVYRVKVLYMLNFLFSIDFIIFLVY